MWFSYSFQTIEMALTRYLFLTSCIKWWLILDELQERCIYSVQLCFWYVDKRDDGDWCSNELAAASTLLSESLDNFSCTCALLSYYWTVFGVCIVCCLHTVCFNAHKVFRKKCMWESSTLICYDIYCSLFLQGLEILKASLHSSVVLTDVFLRGKTSSF